MHVYVLKYMCVVSTYQLTVLVLIPDFPSEFSVPLALKSINLFFLDSLRRTASSVTVLYRYNFVR